MARKRRRLSKETRAKIGESVRKSAEERKSQEAVVLDMALEKPLFVMVEGFDLNSIRSILEDIETELGEVKESRLTVNPEPTLHIIVKLKVREVGIVRRSDG